MSRHPVLAAAAMYALLALAFVSPALVPGRTLANSDQLWFSPPWASTKPAHLQRPASKEESDSTSAYRPWLQFASREAPGIPRWNPYIMAGRPFIANAEAGVFSIFTVPVYILPFALAAGVMVALKLFAAGFGTFLLARALGTRWAGALLAGVVYAFGLEQVTWLLVNAPSDVWVLIPWVLLLTERVVQRATIYSVAGLAVVVSLQFLGGHPESSFHALAAATLFFALRLWRKRRAAGEGGSLSPLEPGPLRTVAAFAVALVWGFALAAIAIVPFVELLAHSADITGHNTGHRTLPRFYLPTLAMADYWGRGTSGTFQPIGRFLYAGALPLMLAVAAPFLRVTAERIAVAVFGLLCLAVAFGLSPIVDIVNVLPGFSKADNTRLTILFLLCVALLAGWALSDLVEKLPSVSRRRLLLAIGTLLLCAPLLWLFDARPSASSLRPALAVAWRFATPPASTEVVRLASLVLWLTMAGAALALLVAYARRHLTGAAFGALALALVIVDLFRLGMGYNPAIARADASQPATPAIRYLQSRRPRRFAGYLDALVPNTAMHYRLYDVRGYDFPTESRYSRLWYSLIDPFQPRSSQPLILAAPIPTSLRVLGLLGVADLMAGSTALVQPNLPVAYRGADATIYANPHAVPRAFVTGAQQLVRDGNAAFHAIADPRFKPRRTVVVERGIAGIPRQAGGQSPPGEAQIVSYAPDHVEVAASTLRPGVLVLTDNYFPGWKATVDGRTVPIERVDYVLRGVRLPPGRHRIDFSYSPSSWRAGWIVTCVALLALAGTLGWAWASRRRST